MARTVVGAAVLTDDDDTEEGAGEDNLDKAPFPVPAVVVVVLVFLEREDVLLMMMIILMRGDPYYYDLESFCVFVACGVVVPEATVITVVGL